MRLRSAADLVGEVLPAGELAPGRHGPGSSTHPARWQGAGCVPQPPAWMESHRACVPRGHTRKATNCRRQSELGRQLAGVDYLGLAAAAELAGVDQGEDLELGDPARRDQLLATQSRCHRWKNRQASAVSIEPSLLRASCLRHTRV